MGHPGVHRGRGDLQAEAHRHRHVEERLLRGRNSFGQQNCELIQCPADPFKILWHQNPSIDEFLVLAKKGHATNFEAPKVVKGLVGLKTKGEPRNVSYPIIILQYFFFQTNTFQSVIVTDEVRTYIMNIYGWMGWTTHTEVIGIPDRTFYNLRVANSVYRQILCTLETCIHRF